MSYNAKQLAAMDDAKQATGVKSRHGKFNLVARIAGSGAKAYDIREAAIGSQGEFRLYCSCPAQKFHSGYGNLCKHDKALLRAARLMIDAGQAKMQGIEIFDPTALERAARVGWAMDNAKSSAKSDNRKKMTRGAK